MKKFIQQTLLPAALGFGIGHFIVASLLARTTPLPQYFWNGVATELFALAEFVNAKNPTYHHLLILFGCTIFSICLFQRPSSFKEMMRCLFTGFLTFCLIFSVVSLSVFIV